MKNNNEKFDLIETLKTEQELLLEKIAKARDKGDAGTYKNLITALRDISRLIHDEEHMRKIYNNNDISEVIEYLIEKGSSIDSIGKKKLDGEVVELINKLGYKINITDKGIYYYK